MLPRKAKRRVKFNARARNFHAALPFFFYLQVGGKRGAHLVQTCLYSLVDLRRIDEGILALHLRD